MAKKAWRQFQEKIIDDTIVLKWPRRGAKLREEVWQTADGEVTKYNLAYINHLVCRVDNWRVFGYDNAHDGHHRRFMGNVEPFEFSDYQSLAKNGLRKKFANFGKGKNGRQEDEQDG